jgi:hypothetical protein
MDELELFTALSRVLTGFEELEGEEGADEKKGPDEKLAPSYLRRLKERYPIPMQNLLTAFAGIAQDEHLIFEVKRRIVENKELQPIVSQVIRIWYTSEFQDELGKPQPGSQREFYGGLLWSAIKAHAPTGSRLDYGDWQKPPAE